MYHEEQATKDHTMSKVITSIEIVSSTHSDLAPQTFDNAAAFNVAIYEVEDPASKCYEKTDVVINLDAHGQAMTYRLRFDVNSDDPDILKRALEGIEETRSLLPLLKLTAEKRAEREATADLFKCCFELAQTQAAIELHELVYGETVKN